MVLNSIMVGFFTAVTRLLEPEAVQKAVADSVPASFRDLNLKAFVKGYDTECSHLLTGRTPRSGSTRSIRKSDGSESERFKVLGSD